MLIVIPERIADRQADKASLTVWNKTDRQTDRQTRFDSIPTMLWKAFTPYIPLHQTGRHTKNTLKKTDRQTDML